MYSVKKNGGDRVEVHKGQEAERQGLLLGLL